SPFLLFGMAAGLVTFIVCLWFWGICIVGAARTKSRCFQFALLLSIILPALWSWEPVRFLLPSLGMLAAGAAFLRGRVATMGIALLLVLNLVSLGSLWYYSERTPLVSAEFKEYAATWPQITDALSWIHSHSRSEDLVVSTIDPMVYLYAGR